MTHCIFCQGLLTPDFAHPRLELPLGTEFTEIYKGFRYRFPSANEQAEFRKDPARYAAAGKTNGRSTQSNDRPTGKDVLTVTGKTACAGCEYGVTPIQNREELGGEVVNEVSLAQGELKTRPPTGYIGFQDHGLPLWLRNIRVRELK